MKRLCLVAALAFVLAPACKKDGQGGAGPAAAVSKGPPGLAYVPADTPYVMAMLEPMPPDLIDKMMKPSEKAIEKQLEMVKRLEAAEGADTPEPVLRVTTAMLEEFRGNANAAGLERLGIGTKTRIVIYGIGVLPAMRWDVADGTKVRALIERIMARAKVTAPTKKLGAQDYWEIEAPDDIRIVFAVIGNEVAAGMMHVSTSAQVLPLILGQTKPDKNILEAGTLQQVAAQHRFSPIFVGYGDLKGLASLLMGERSGLAQDATNALTGGPPPSLSADCRREIHSLVDLAPRVALGYDEISAQRMTMSMVAEARPDVAKLLAGVRASVPGLAMRPDGPALAAFGVGIDMQKAIDALKPVFEKIRKDPYKCPELEGLNEMATEATALDTQVPPMLLAVRGFYAVVEDFSAAGTVKARAVIATERPMELIAMGSGVLPPLRAANVKDDGRPVRVSLADIAPSLGDAWIAVQGKHIGLAVGAGMEQKIAATMNAKAPSDGPVVTFGYDIAAVMSRLGGLLGSDADDMVAMMEGWGYGGYSLLMTERGPTLRIGMEMK